jgi:hypothetical protein
LSENSEANPSKSFEEVVGAGDELEKEAVGNTAVLSACWSQVAKHDVGDEVAQFSHCKEGEANVSRRSQI